MPFGLFGKKAKTQEPKLGAMLADFVLHRQVMAKLEKAKSLVKLGRESEARGVVSQIEHTLAAYTERDGGSFEAHVLRALVHMEMGAATQAITELEGILSSAHFTLSQQQRDIVAGELQRLRRQQPRGARSRGEQPWYTTVYGCQNCGRLVNFVSMRCPHCEWRANSIEEMARSMVLSNDHLKIPALLILAREVSAGRSPRDVVRNLDALAKDVLQQSQWTDVAHRIYALLDENDAKSARFMRDVRCCTACDERVLWSGSTECDHCGAQLNWPELVRTLVCVDNLLWLLEQRVEPSNSEEFSELVCVLIVIFTTLLRKQEPPSPEQREYVLHLLEACKCVADKNRGGIVDTHDLTEMKIYLVKADMLEDSQSFTTFLFRELEFFVTRMKQGVAL